MENKIKESIVKDEKFLILKFIKLYILSLDTYVNNLPRSEYILKDNILRKSYELYDLVVLSNLDVEREINKKKIIATISALDFYIEICFKNNYISSNKYKKISNELGKINKLVIGWIKNGS